MQCIGIDEFGMANQQWITLMVSIITGIFAGITSWIGSLRETTFVDVVYGPWRRLMGSGEIRSEWGILRE